MKAKKQVLSPQFVYLLLDNRSGSILHGAANLSLEHRESLAAWINTGFTMDLKHAAGGTQTHASLALLV